MFSLGMLSGMWCSADRASKERTHTRRRLLLTLLVYGCKACRPPPARCRAPSFPLSQGA